MDRLKQKILLMNSLDSDNIPNLLLFGKKGVGKKYLLFQNLNDNYSLHHIKPTRYENFILNYNNIYYVVTMSLITYSNVDKMFTYLQSMIGKINCFKNQLFTIFIFTDFQNIKQNIQNKLRVLIEKYRKTTIFIFVSNNYNSVSNPIKSRCLCIRIPADNNLKVFQKNNDSNIYHIQIYNEYNTYFQKYKDPTQILCDKLFTIYRKELNEFNFKDIQMIRDISYHLLKSNISIILFYHQLVNYCIQNPRWIQKIKYTCIYSISQSEHMYHKSYKSIIHIESLLIQLYYLTAAYYEVNS
jgi:DNA polymerase III delta prime subunit